MITEPLRVTMRVAEQAGFRYYGNVDRGLGAQFAVFDRGGRRWQIPTDGTVTTVEDAERLAAPSQYWAKGSRPDPEGEEPEPEE